MKVRLECRHHNDLFAHFHSHFWSAAISWTSLNFTFSSPELRLFLSCLDYICPLWKSAMFKTKSAYGSHGLGLLPLPGEKYCSISLTNGKPIEIEKPTIIPQLKNKAPMWSQHFWDHVQSTFMATWPDLVVWHGWHAVPTGDTKRDKSLRSLCFPTKPPWFISAATWTQPAAVAG